MRNEPVMHSQQDAWFLKQVKNRQRRYLPKIMGLLSAGTVPEGKGNWFSLARAFIYSERVEPHVCFVLAQARDVLAGDAVLCPQNSAPRAAATALTAAGAMSPCAACCEAQSYCFSGPCPFPSGGITASLLSARAGQGWQDSELAALGKQFPCPGDSYGAASPVIFVCNN